MNNASDPFTEQCTLLLSWGLIVIQWGTSSSSESIRMWKLYGPPNRILSVHDISSIADLAPRSNPSSPASSTRGRWSQNTSYSWHYTLYSSFFSTRSRLHQRTAQTATTTNTSGSTPPSRNVSVKSIHRLFSSLRRIFRTICRIGNSFRAAETVHQSFVDVGKISYGSF